MESGEVVIASCGNLFVASISAPDMVNHLKISAAKQNLDVKLLLNFQNLVINELKEHYHTTLTDLGTCSLHSANNRFGKLIKEIDGNVELDQMAI